MRNPSVNRRKNTKVCKNMLRRMSTVFTVLTNKGNTMPRPGNKNITLSIPIDLHEKASRFFATKGKGEFSDTVARLLRAELRRKTLKEASK
jgi:hypothetical protein